MFFREKLTNVRVGNVVDYNKKETSGLNLRVDSEGAEGIRSAVRQQVQPSPVRNISLLMETWRGSQYLERRVRVNHGNDGGDDKDLIG